MDETLRDAARQFERGKRRRYLSTQRIVFLVVAAAAPLAAMIGNLPIALGRGAGSATPEAFLFAGVTLFCFAVGYAAMGKRVVNTGAFYTYIAKGLGKPLGIGAAFTAMIAYVGFTIGLAAFFGYFVDLIAAQIGVHLPWAVYGFIGVAAIAVLGYRSIDLSSEILGMLMLAEVLVLAVFDASVVLAKGAGAFPLQSFSPHAMLTPGAGVSLMIAFTSFLGFESAALYGEEAKEPTRSIPLATYISVCLIGIFYLVTAWITVGALGAAHAKAEAVAQGGLMMFGLFTHYDGPIATMVMSVLVCTSILASYLALHNAATRYIFALSREKLMPPSLGRFNPVRYAPSNASLAVSVATVACVAAFAMTRLDPYKAGVPILIGFGTLGIIFLQGFAAIAILAYFARSKTGRQPWIIAASGIGAIGLILAAALVSANFRLLSTSNLPLIDELPLIYPMVVVCGVLFGLWLRAYRPKTYTVLAAADLRTDVARAAIAPIAYSGRYCIVGGGPCGLLAARAFRLAGIPYDQFERHSGVGGIWDIENPGSSMYQSAHFISSKYTSAFFGFPMPASYPDYPSFSEIHAYIERFADTFDLRRSIEFGVAVTHAEPLGANAEGGWRVTLSNGESRHYKGLICANGVTWHPNMPSYPGLEAFKGEVRHTVSYRDAREFQDKRVLIVGAGNSGVDIACDAARNADAAFISLRRGYHFVPKHIFGVPTDVFLSGQMHPPKGVVIPDEPNAMLGALVGDLTRYGLPAPDHKVMESHPIMNTQILHYLAHGDLKARGDIARFTPTGVVFTDGREEVLDLILFATGYEYSIPYLDKDLFTWNQGRPELYLNIFHRSLKGLSVVGFLEFASAGYQRFDEIAQMAAMDAYIEQSGKGRAEWAHMKAQERPNLRGEKEYIQTPRHANYVDVTVYRRMLAEIREKFGWPDPDHELYRDLAAAQFSQRVAAE